MKSFCLRTARNSLLFAVFINSLHWLSVRFYAYKCSPDGFSGWVNSFVSVANPLCTVGTMILSKTQEVYATVLLAVGISFCSFLAGIFGSLLGGLTAKPKPKETEEHKVSDKNSSLDPIQGGSCENEKKIIMLDTSSILTKSVPLSEPLDYGNPQHTLQKIQGEFADRGLQVSIENIKKMFGVLRPSKKSKKNKKRIKK